MSDKFASFSDCSQAKTIMNRLMFLHLQVRSMTPKKGGIERKAELTKKKIPMKLCCAQKW
jgi:hypothetical protein